MVCGVVSGGDFDKRMQIHRYINEYIGKYIDRYIKCMTEYIRNTAIHNHLCWRTDRIERQIYRIHEYTYGHPLKNTRNAQMNGWNSLTNTHTKHKIRKRAFMIHRQRNVYNSHIKHTERWDEYIDTQAE